jgi:hypothetical protein
MAGAESTIVKSGLWTKDQTKLALHLYCQLPFGKLHQGNSEIIDLATLIERTPSAVAMKLVNFASFDPAITGSGRKGLSNASALDREVWDEFNADWEGLAIECQHLREALSKQAYTAASSRIDPEFSDVSDYTGETKRVMTEQRIKQSFFRRAVLSSYRGSCCMSGVSEPRLLLASHIVPWSKDKSNRLNPRNGLCLSAIHDRAFDKGLITLSDELKIIVSDELKRQKDTFIEEAILSLEGRSIALPQRFLPSLEFVSRHRTEVFVDNQKA